MTDSEKMLEAVGNIALLVGGLAKHAADIAHARRSLYDAYLKEGFTEAQALELCKVLMLS